MFLTKKIQYNNCDIPARLFFDKVISGDVSVLGYNNPEKAQEAYFSIIDEFCEIDQKKRILSWFVKQQKISRIQSIITQIKACLYAISVCRTKEQIDKAIDLINSIEGAKVKFKVKTLLTDEIDRVQSSVIGILNNQLNTLTADSEKKQENIKQDFAERLVNIENILNRNIDENVSLRKFIFLEQSAINKANPKQS